MSVFHSSHRPGLIWGIFGAALALWFGLAWTVVREHPEFKVVKSAPKDVKPISVVAQPGTSYFFTWGVTARPRSKLIAQRSLPEEERFGNTYQQTHGVLTNLRDDLEQVGLNLRDVVHVRAYVVGDAENPPDFEASDRAFRDFFGTALQPHVPAITKIGIARLFLPAYLTEIEFIAAFPPGRGPLVPGTRPWLNQERLRRVETRPEWRSIGRPMFQMSTGKAVQGGQALAVTSALQASPLNPKLPEAAWTFGTTAQQSTSLLKRGEAMLATAGMDYKDVFFVRTIMFPEKGVNIGRNFAAFGTEYGKLFNNATNPNRPTRTVMSAPGYAYRKEALALEMYALAKDPATAVPEDARLKSYPRPGQPISDVVVVSPRAALGWMAGIAEPAAGTLEAQATACLQTLETRLTSLGGGLGDVAHIRAYVVAKDMEPRIAVAGWMKAYSTVFGTEKNPHKPALTVLPVVALPGGGLIEVESLAALPPAAAQK